MILLQSLNLSQIVGGRSGYSAAGHFAECRPRTVEQCRISRVVRSLTVRFSRASVARSLALVDMVLKDSARRASSLTRSLWTCRGMRQLSGTMPEMKGKMNGENSPNTMKASPKIGIRRESCRVRLTRGFSLTSALRGGDSKVSY